MLSAFAVYVLHAELCNSASKLGSCRRPLAHASYVCSVLCAACRALQLNVKAGELLTSCTSGMHRVRALLQQARLLEVQMQQQAEDAAAGRRLPVKDTRPQLQKIHTVLQV